MTTATIWIAAALIKITADNKTAVEELVSCTLNCQALSFKFSTFHISFLMGSMWLQ
jgi:hypothetical protein